MLLLMSRARLLRAVVVLIVNAGCLLLLSAILPDSTSTALPRPSSRRFSWAR